MKAEKAELVGGVCSQAAPVLSKVWAGPTPLILQTGKLRSGKESLAEDRHTGVLHPALGLVVSGHPWRAFGKQGLSAPGARFWGTVVSRGAKDPVKT